MLLSLSYQCSMGAEAERRAGYGEVWSASALPAAHSLGSGSCVAVLLRWLRLRLRLLGLRLRLGFAADGFIVRMTKRSLGYLRSMISHSSRGCS